MTIIRDIAELLLLLERSGYLTDRATIADLGTAYPNNADSNCRSFEHNALSINHARVSTIQELYSAIGFSKYVQVPWPNPNEENPSSPAHEQTSKKCFDIVTNLFASAGEIDQAAFFEAMHRLTKPNGLMLHVLPFQRPSANSRFGYSVNLIVDLALANNYKIIGIFAGTKDGLRGIGPNDSAARDIPGEINLLAVLQQVESNPFRARSARLAPTSSGIRYDAEDTNNSPREYVEVALSTIGYPLNSLLEPAQSKGNRIRIVVPVWGDFFIRSFIEFSLRYQIRSDMLKFEERENLEYVIITDIYGERAIRSSQEYNALNEIAAVRFILNDHLDGLSAYDRLTASYNLAIRSSHVGDLIIFVTSDCFFSCEVFHRIKYLSETHSVIMSPALRVVEETFVSEINMSGNSKFDGRSVLELALRHEHPLTEAFCINNERGVVHPQPAQIIYRVDNGYVGRWNVMHPIAIRISNASQPIVATIDYNYPLFHIRSWSDVAVMDRITDGLVVSLTPLGYSQGEPFIRGNSPSAHVRNLKAWATNPWPLNFHLAQLEHPVRLVVNEADASKQIDAGEKAIGEISERFLNYVNSRKTKPHGNYRSLNALDLFRPAVEQRQKRVLARRRAAKALRRLIYATRRRLSSFLQL